MSETIIHNGRRIVVLDEGETPAYHCQDSDIFIQGDSAGMYWVSSWDGRESWPLGGDSSGPSLEVAVEDAKGCIEMIGGDDA